MNKKLIDGLQKIIDFVVAENDDYYNYSSTDTCILGTFVGETYGVDFDWYYDHKCGIQVLKDIFGIDIQKQYDDQNVDDSSYTCNPFFDENDGYYTPEENIVVALFRESYIEDGYDVKTSIWLCDAMNVIKQLETGVIDG